MRKEKDLKCGSIAQVFAPCMKIEKSSRRQQRYAFVELDSFRPWMSLQNHNHRQDKDNLTAYTEISLWRTKLWIDRLSINFLGVPPDPLRKFFLFWEFDILLSQH